MKPALRIAALLAAAFLLAACPHRVTILVYNNTGSERALVRANETRIAWPPGSSLDIRRERGVLHTVSPRSGQGVFILVAHEEGVDRYGLDGVVGPHGYALDEPASGMRPPGAVYHIQFEADGGAYLLPGAAAFPAAPPPPQPEGFPLWPEGAGG